jgi:uncharacterized lipoprotein NlpE involved in copper resistance
MQHSIKINFNYLTIMMAFLLFIGCESDKNEGEEINTIDMHTSENALDWVGAYKGILPCADCEGIETVLELNDDQTYLLQTRYLGVDEEIQIEEMGIFTWDISGQKIQLNNKQAPNQYKIGEDIIWCLDINGEIITGDLAIYYILRKH